jgi:hypothetical protein
MGSPSLNAQDAAKESEVESSESCKRGDVRATGDFNGHPRRRSHPFVEPGGSGSQPFVERYEHLPHAIKGGHADDLEETDECRSVVVLGHEAEELGSIFVLAHEAHGHGSVGVLVVADDPDEGTALPAGEAAEHRRPFEDDEAAAATSSRPRPLVVA